MWPDGGELTTDFEHLMVAAADVRESAPSGSDQFRPSPDLKLAIRLVSLAT
jgi:hypothetical protein